MESKVQDLLSQYGGDLKNFIRSHYPNILKEARSTAIQSQHKRFVTLLSDRSIFLVTYTNDRDEVKQNIIVHKTNCCKRSMADARQIYSTHLNRCGIATLPVHSTNILDSYLYHIENDVQVPFEYKPDEDDPLEYLFLAATCFFANEDCIQSVDQDLT